MKEKRMSVTVKAGDLYVSKDTLNALVAQRLPPTTSFRIARAVREINKELEQFTETRNKLIMEHGEQLENGDWRVKEELQDAYAKAINAVANEEIELPIKPLRPGDLGGAEITPAQAMTILYLFEDE